MTVSSSKPALSIAIMTHNEMTEFAWLMEVLRPLVSDEVEIVVLDDFSEPEMISLIQQHPVRFHQRALNKNFSAQRNHLKKLCSGEFIFLLDPDEIPQASLLSKLPQLIEKMRANNLDACTMPRLNRVIDSDAPVDARTLSFTDDDLRQQARDDQMRLIRNTASIRWVNHVHERLTGVMRCGRLPQRLDCSLLHVKNRRRADHQNSFYRSIHARYLDKLRKSIAKRMGRLHKPVWIDLEP